MLACALLCSIAHPFVDSKRAVSDAEASKTGAARARSREPTCPAVASGGGCDPVLAVGDGALGFWKALRDVFADAKEQR